MIEGIGIDIIEVERVREKLSKNSGFREKVFSVDEIEFCESKGENSAQHYAARFAAKEAFLKATGKGLQLSHELNEIEIKTNEMGKPELCLSKKVEESMGYKNFKLMVSLSHLQSTACAVVIIETNWT